MSISPPALLLLRFAWAVSRRRPRFQTHRRQRHAGWQHGLGGRAPGEPCHLHDLRPKRKWAGTLDKTAERLEGGHSLQRGQQGERMRRVGVLMGFEESNLEAKAFLSAFTQGLAELGWTD